MSRLLGRTALHVSAVSAAVIASGLGAGSAQAAMGGGKIPALTDRPNLVSVTTTGTSVSFNYDRTINCEGGTCNPAEFQIGTYGSFLAPIELVANAVTVSGSSVRATFLGGNPDTDAFTYGRVDNDAVNTQGTLGATNLGDSVRITGSEDESGTRGHTNGPDLISAVATGGGSNFITLTFDQEIDDATFDPTAVSITRADGSVVSGLAGTASVDDNVADVEFAAGVPVAGAKQVAIAAAAAQSVDLAFPNTLRSVRVGTQNQDSQAPMLVSAELTGADAILFTFDKAVTNPAAGSFAVDLPFPIAVPIPGSTATVVGDGKQVQVQFPTDQITEYLVGASVAPGAVLAQADGTPSTASGVPTGGNAGAKATGYTTGPEAVQTTYSGANVAVTLDGRIVPGLVTPAGFQLLADDGTVIGGTPTATPQAQGVPGPSRVNLLYNTTAVGNARALRLQPATVISTAGGPNVDQQLGR
ncbi:hypothetical protein DSM112329_04899 [Paraconexibacter sp. AEG42_29]|uniref:Uncharacterized protein n=1 Tax=Paraconexibacter sp. AEG42_29 TaxID=2997339 RepID=A0AAU7B246_9ACTN